MENKPCVIDLNKDNKWVQSWEILVYEDGNEEQMVFAVYCDSYEDAKEEHAKAMEYYDIGGDNDLGISTYETLKRYEDF